MRWLLGVLALVLLGAGALWLMRGRGGLDQRLQEQLAGRGDVLVVGTALGELPAIEGTRWRAGELDALLGQPDRGELASAMREAGIDALLVAAGPRVEDRDVPLRVALAAYQPVTDLRGVYLAPSHALYAPAVSTDLGPAAAALPRIARRILQGHTPPRISRFPEPLRRIRNVEVMVLLRDRGRARLWRSARGSSVARALVTATVVARQRWQEREGALGGPLDERLPFLDVEVSLLEEDGTLGVATPAFVERVFFEEHGVAYERPGAWRYLLPEATRRAGGGSAVAAYRKLFADNALPPDSFGRPDLRFYRLVVTELGVSPAPANRAPDPDDGLAEEALFDTVAGDEEGGALGTP